VREALVATIGRDHARLGYFEKSSVLMLLGPRKENMILKALSLPQEIVRGAVGIEFRKSCC
jgi:hypothetical protein